MSESTTNKSSLSLIVTKSSRMKDLVIKNGQLIFMQDIGRIALDFNNTRVFYNQIVEINTESERLALESPLSGYYFVIDEAVLWHYQDGWKQITDKPKDLIFVGVELPELGQANKIYIDKFKKEISIWEEETERFITVSNFAEEVSDEDIENLFIE